VNESREILPAEGQLALNRRQADSMAEAEDALRSASASAELVLVAESLRLARNAFDRLTGRAGVEDLLDALFGRFCLGK
jgi:tRNA modification GTPase